MSLALLRVQRQDLPKTIQGHVVVIDPIAAAALGAVQRGVGACQQLLQRFASLEPGYTDRAGDVQPAVVDGVVAADAAVHGVQAMRGTRRQPWQQRQQFFAAVTADAVVAAHQRIHAVADPGQHGVAGQVAMLIVDHLK